MKRFNRILILTVILAVCCFAAYAVVKFEEDKEQIRNYEEVILAVAEADIQAISWEQGENVLGFHRDSDRIWRWDDDAAFPVDDTVMAEMLGMFESFSAAFSIENVEDYSQYGFDEPECVIRLTTAGTSYTLKLGAFSKLDEQRYIDIGDGNVYLVSQDPMDTYDAELSDMIDHDELPTFEMVNSIAFAGTESYTLSYKEDVTASYCMEDVYFWEEKPLDTQSVENYLTDLSCILLTDYVSYNATDEELKKYGLDSPALSVAVTYTVVNEDDTETADTFTIHVGVLTEAAAETDSEPTTTAYARVGDSQIIYKLRKSDETCIFAYTYDELRHKDVFTADFETVTAIEITLEGTTHNLVKSTVTNENSEEETIWKYAEEKMDVTEIQSMLTALTADSFTDTEATDKEEIRLVIYMDNNHSDTMEIVLYRYSGEYCLCKVNGESISMISRDSVVDLMEAVNAIVLN